MFGKLSAVEDKFKTGCGIGLTICKRIVEEHGGEIGLWSLPGSGSTFKFYLPY